MLYFLLHLIQAVGALLLLLLLLSPLYMPFVFLFLFLIGKGDLANKIWSKIKSKMSKNDTVKSFQYSSVLTNPSYNYLDGNIYNSK